MSAPSSKPIEARSTEAVGRPCYEKLDPALIMVDPEPQHEDHPRMAQTKAPEM
jgi:hypothetical protein